jgi:hypothetical protein
MITTYLKRNLHLTREFFIEEYETKQKSLTQISKEFKITKRYLTLIFREYMIRIRPAGSHLFTTLQTKAQRILSIFPFATKDFIISNYITQQKSLPDFATEFNIDSYQLQTLLKFYKIPSRTISEAALTKRFKHKLYKTLEQKYGNGVINISQSELIKNKKSTTCLTKFGVDNFFKKHDFKEIKNAGFIKNHGITCSEFKSMGSKNVWLNKTSTERTAWLEKSICSDSAKVKSLSNRTGYTISKGEDKLSNILTLLKITHTRQHIIKYTTDNKARRYFYDIFIPELKLLIEFNGDYWHANPQIYKATDILKFPGRTITAQDQWNTDYLKTQIAKQNKYNIITLWEADTKNLTDDQLIYLLKTKMYEYTSA